MTAKTAVIYRPFLGMEVKQDIDTMFYNATEVLKAYNKKEGSDMRLDRYLDNISTKRFIDQLTFEENVNTTKSGELKNQYSPIITKRGKYGGTWMHSKLLLDFMMWLSPEMKSKAYDFILEGFSLAGKRNELKDGFKKMTKAISETGNSNYREEATMINVLVTGSPANNQRARLSKDKMDLMDDLQKTNASLIRAGLSLESRKNILAKSLVSTL